MPSYKIVSSLVGPFPAGRVVSADELRHSDGVDVARLLRKGAIVETTDPITAQDLGATPYGVFTSGGKKNPSEIDPLSTQKKGEAEGAEGGDDEGNDAYNVDDRRKELAKELKDDLVTLAKELQVEDAEAMNKGELVDAIIEKETASAE